MAEIYCFNLSGEVHGYVAALAARYRIRMTDVGPEKFGLTIRELTAGFPGRQDGKLFEDQLLLMDHLSDQQLNGFLDDLKQCTPGYQGLKAIVTKSNRKWTAFALIEELRKEKASLEQEAASDKSTAQ